MAIKEYLKEGAAAVYAKFENPAPPVGIKDENCEFNHVSLGRLVVFPQIKD